MGEKRRIFVDCLQTGHVVWRAAFVLYLFAFPIETRKMRAPA